MDMVAYAQRMEAIKQAAARMFELAGTEDEVCQLEQAIGREVMYLAAIAPIGTGEAS